MPQNPNSKKKVNFFHVHAMRSYRGLYSDIKLSIL